MTREAFIFIKFTDWWLSGTGRAGSGDVDAVPHRDRFGCPALPMTQVKGQLLETARRLADAEAGGWRTEHISILFGEGNKAQAALAFRGDASLDEGTARRFAKNDKAAKMLTRRLASIRIGRLGAAQDRMLRAFEAAVPLELTGRVSWIGEGDPMTGWVDLIDAACAATLAFGKMKTDGYGRAIACCKEIAA